MPQAVGLAKRLLSELQPHVSVLLTPTSGGRFEVLLNGKLIFSKHRTGRFPKEDEILQAIQRPQAT
ncbi:MAG: SelT/SelW/SelH family protein [Chloroflexi bacterium]|nr:SelT/SelW/SelH family protein [Chloroflexota bacterium]